MQHTILLKQHLTDGVKDFISIFVHYNKELTWTNTVDLLTRFFCWKNKLQRFCGTLRTITLFFFLLTQFTSHNLFIISDRSFDFHILPLGSFLKLCNSLYIYTAKKVLWSFLFIIIRFTFGGSVNKLFAIIYMWFSFL